MWDPSLFQGFWDGRKIEELYCYEVPTQQVGNNFQITSKPNKQ